MCRTICSTEWMARSKRAPRVRCVCARARHLFRANSFGHCWATLSQNYILDFRHSTVDRSFMEFMECILINYHQIAGIPGILYVLEMNNSNRLCDCVRVFNFEHSINFNCKLFTCTIPFICSSARASNTQYRRAIASRWIRCRFGIIVVRATYITIIDCRGIQLAARYRRTAKIPTHTETARCSTNAYLIRTV